MTIRKCLGNAALKGSARNRNRCPKGSARNGTVP